MRSVPALLVGALLLIAACGGSSSSAAPGPSTASNPSPAAGGTPIVVKDFTLDPLALEVHGSTVDLDVSNAGPTVHNVTIRDGGGAVLGGTRDLREAEDESISIAAKPGTYVLFCSLPGHESLGIKGTLVVEP